MLVPWCIIRLLGCSFVLCLVLLIISSDALGKYFLYMILWLVMGSYTGGEHILIRVPDYHKHPTPTPLPPTARRVVLETQMDDDGGAVISAKRGRGRDTERFRFSKWKYCHCKQKLMSNLCIFVSNTSNYFFKKYFWNYLFSRNK